MKLKISIQLTNEEFEHMHCLELKRILMLISTEFCRCSTREYDKPIILYDCDNNCVGEAVIV